MTSPWEHFEAALSKKSISFEAIKDNITDDAELKQFIEALGITDFALVVSIKAEFKKRQRTGPTYQLPPKRQKIKAKESPFLYGEQSFLDFGEGAFFRDNTQFIELLEQQNLKAVVSLHPRRFGKSLFVSMLNEYYDIKNKDRLKELFGEFWIWKNLTRNAATFLILPLDFSNLEIIDYATFNQDFNIKNNVILNEFIRKYKQELGEVALLDETSDFVANFRKLCGMLKERGLKMYVTIDEYDTSLMEVFSNQILVNSMKIKKENKDPKVEESEKIESQFKRFFSSLKEANKGDVNVFVTGVSPLCLTEFTSGWNHFETISNDEDFAELYGLTEKDIRKGIEMIKPSIPKDIQEKLISYCDFYNGYCFYPEQKNRLFNPGRIVYFLKKVRSRWLKQHENLKGEELFKRLVKFKKTQTKPAESTLKYITTSEVSRSLLQDLLKEENATIQCEKGIDPGFSLEQIQVDRRSLISFMFYTGALTYAGECSFRIPNSDAKVEFVEAAMRTLEIDMSLFTHVKEGIDKMLENEDISVLCKAFEQGHKDRGVRDTIQGEVSFQEVVFNRLLLCRNPLDKVNSEYVVAKKDRESNQQAKKKTIDIVYTDYKTKRRFCFELKNLRVQDLLAGNKNEDKHDILKRVSTKFSTIEDKTILEYALKPKIECPIWFQEDWAPTVGEFMEKICKNQVCSKYQPDLQKDDLTEGKSLAWVIVRVGLGKVIYQRVF